MYIFVGILSLDRKFNFSCIVVIKADRAVWVDEYLSVPEKLICLCRRNISICAGKMYLSVPAKCICVEEKCICLCWQNVFVCVCEMYCLYCKMESAFPPFKSSVSWRKSSNPINKKYCCDSDLSAMLPLVNLFQVVIWSWFASARW